MAVGAGLRGAGQERGGIWAECFVSSPLSGSWCSVAWLNFTCIQQPGDLICPECGWELRGQRGHPEKPRWISQNLKRKAQCFPHGWSPGPSSFNSEAGSQSAGHPVEQGGQSAQQWLSVWMVCEKTAQPDQGDTLGLVQQPRPSVCYSSARRFMLPDNDCLV